MYGYDKRYDAEKLYDTCRDYGTILAVIEEIKIYDYKGTIYLFKVINKNVNYFQIIKEYDIPKPVIMVKGE